ncbi:sensor histidine kinase [Subtercola boreus]|nr:HAMP domain-containing sensor histidine kinase [Subtercola boreus]
MTVVLVIVAGVVFAIVSVDVNESNQRSVVVASQLDSVQETPSGTYITVVEHGRQISSDGLPDGLVDTDALASAAALADTGDGRGGGGSSGGGTGGGSSALQSQRTVDGQTYLINTSRHGDRIVQVAVNLSEGSEELTRLAVALVIAGLVALVVAAALSYLMARRAIRPLADALELQRQFVADASHELRTPLTILSTRAQLLQRRGRSDLPADVGAAVDGMVRDSRALTGILDDLLIAADTRSEVPLAPIDVTRTADAAIATLQDDADRLGITLSRSGTGADSGAGAASGPGAGTDSGPAPGSGSAGSGSGPAAAGPGAPVTVNGSEAALLRLHIALLTNALDHAREAVRVDIAVEGGSVVIRVIDDGPGFDPAIADRAFARFASTRPATPAGNGATHYGLGLALVAEIARRHHGSVRIEQPTGAGVGAIVAVRIPLSTAA